MIDLRLTVSGSHLPHLDMVVLFALINIHLILRVVELYLNVRVFFVCCFIYLYFLKGVARTVLLLSMKKT